MYYVIELWRPRQAWRDLTAEQRTAFLSGMDATLESLTAVGVRPVAMGRAEPLLEESPWAFYTVWRSPTRHDARRLTTADDPQMDGYFELVRISGADEGPAALAHAMTALP
ncbi:DUF6616 family protein [Streptomyces sp. AHA2]|uniref:DUF6616 family protein n=1 Tax=Streptomyces sp. AHA2 TaxID=3064526 RepID=UPI002FE142A5